MKLIFVLTFIAVLWTAELSNAQTFSTKLELEVTQTKEFGKILTLKVNIKNESDQDIFLDNFIPLFEIEKYNSTKGKFENYLDFWFAQMRYDSIRELSENIINQQVYEHNKSFDKSFSEEIIKYNKAIKDSSDLRFWTNHKIERIEVFGSKSKIEWQEYINSLPAGSYRLKFYYSNLKEKRTIDPIEKYKDMRLPEKLGKYTKWKGEIISEPLYLTIK